MRIATLVCALLASATVAAQPFPPVPVNTEALVARVETSASAYASGETIEVRFTLSNPTDALAVIAGSESCIVQFVLDDFESVYNTACTLQDVGIPIPPRGARTWVWRLDPRDLGLPTRSGTHRLVGYHSGALRDTTTFDSPRNLGGLLAYRTAEGVTAPDLAALRDSLQAEVLFEYPAFGGIGGEWRIAGVSLDSTAARLAAEARFRSAEALRFVSYDRVFATDGEPAAPPSARLRAFPNPASEFVTLDLDRDGEVEVVDALGRTVMTVQATGRRAHIDTSRLPVGAYAARVAGRAAVRFTVAR